jgi:hypothetical protein
MTLAICAVIFGLSLIFSLLLGRFLKACDDRHADMLAVLEAERIIDEESLRVWGP